MSAWHLTVPTELGDAEATKAAQGECWEISYPWASDRFYGTVTQVKKRMAIAIKRHEEIVDYYIKRGAEEDRRDAEGDS